MISPQKIRWNGSSSTMLPFDITTCLSFDGDSGDAETYLGREAVVSETYNGEIKRGNSYKWSESLSPSITIMKKNFGDFTREENRAILSWLTGRKTAGFLDVYLDENSNSIEYSILGNFVRVSQYKLGNSRVVGYIAQFESLMPWALSDLESIEKDVSEPANNTFIISINTDEPESAVYPRITIVNNGQDFVRIANNTVLNESSNMIVNTAYFNGTTYYWRTLNPTKKYGSAKPAYDEWEVVDVDHEYGDKDEWETGYIYKYNNTYYWLEPANTLNSSNDNPHLTAIGVKITNTYAANGETYVATCSVANNTLTETIVLDGANNVVSSSRTSRIFDKDFSWEWIPLYNGVNTIKVEGNCSVTFEYRDVRKVGEF